MCIYYFTYDNLNHDFSCCSNVYIKNKCKSLDIVDKFLHGSCAILQKFLIDVLHESEPYEEFHKTTESDFFIESFTDFEDMYLNDHKFIKYKGKFIDIRGIYDTEEEYINECKKDQVRMNNKIKIEDIDMYISPCETESLDWLKSTDTAYLSAQYATFVILNDPKMKKLIE